MTLPLREAAALAAVELDAAPVVRLRVLREAEPLRQALLQLFLRSLLRRHPVQALEFPAPRQLRAVELLALESRLAVRSRPIF